MGTSVDAFVGRFVGASVGVLEGLKTGKSTLVGPVIGALVGALVVPLVDPLVGRGSLSPALCVAQGKLVAILQDFRSHNIKRISGGATAPPSWTLQPRPLRTPLPAPDSGLMLT